jgi:phosphoadenosine phosphosulfate reductase
MLQRLDQLDLDSINAVLGASDPVRVVQWAARTFGEQLLMSSSFGAESAALIHVTTRVIPGIRILLVDTGYLFRETHAFMQSLRERFNLNILIARAEHSPAEYLLQAGETEPSLRADVESCCAANKNEPFDRAMRELKPAAWIRGIRRDQTVTRAHRSIVERWPRHDCYAISPILNWSAEQLHEYMQANDLPFHPLYRKGYRSIGCSPLSCTRPVKPGEDARAGRWSSMERTECGLHLQVKTG